MCKSQSFGKKEYFLFLFKKMSRCLKNVTKNNRVNVLNKSYKTNPANPVHTKT